MFDNRVDAARRLAKVLAAFAGDHPLVLAIPRGAVPMGRELADALGGDLDVVLVRKLGAPGSREFAVGAIDESGWSYVADYAAEVGADEGYLAREKRAQLELLRERRTLYTPARHPIDPAGRVVFVVDDGLATGATMIAALHSVRARKPARLYCAVPVAARESLAKVAPYADKMICLETPEDFHAVSQFYREFRQIEDEEVIEILKRPARARAPAP